MAGDILAVFISFLLAASIKVAISQPFELRLVFSKIDYTFVLCIFLYPILYYIFELYDDKRCKINVRLLVYLAVATVSATVISVFIHYIFTANIIIGRVIFVSHIIFTVLLTFLWRKAFLRFVSENGKQNILFIGISPIIDEIKNFLKTDDTLRPKALDTIGEYSENPGTVTINGSATAASLTDLVGEAGYDTVIVADSLRNLPILRKHLFDLKFSGIKIYDAPYYYQILKGKVPVSHVKDTWFLFHNQGEAFNSFGYRRAKKVVDVTVALIGLIISSPLMLLVSAAVKASSNGPVFFRQVRLGQNEKPFMLLKFRTMIDHAEKATGPKWASEDDPRITSVGKILRKSRLDELPQLINILKGDMSFVGPRPIRKHFADLLSEQLSYYRLRFMIKPGLTGWAQVRGDYAGSEEGQAEKLEYDLYYVQNQSILFDLFIIVKTVQTILFRRGV